MFYLKRCLVFVFIILMCPTIALAESPRPVGDSIQEGMEQSKRSHDAGMKAMERHRQGKNLSTQERMRLQHEMMKQKQQQEVTKKAADKSSQGVQTLLKGQ